MYPAPGPMVQATEAKGALAATIFEEHPPFTNNPGAAEFVQAFHERAAKAGLPYTGVETQAAASYTAWQVLEAAVNATKSLDDKVLADWIKKNKIDTIQGKLRFDGPSNYGDDLMRRVAEGGRGARRDTAGSRAIAITVIPTPVHFRRRNLLSALLQRKRFPRCARDDE
jgi:branched-chain amino acid transport system substrate-binding protein